MVEAMGDFDKQDWVPADSARRFECGSPNMLSIHALHASLSLLLETGIEHVATRIQSNTQYLINKLQGKASILSPLAAEKRSGIITIRTADTDLAARYRHLQAAGVICALRGGGIRFSPHFYTQQAQLDKALKHLFEPL
jgi:selenocysteine lyase/cysteine desulfurase